MDDSERTATTAASAGASADGYRDSDTHRAGEDLDRIASWCAGATRALDVATGARHTARALRAAGFEVRETEHVERRIEVEPWIDRVDAPDETEIRRALDEAPDAIVEAFGIEYDDGTAVAFESQTALIRAEARE